MLNIIIVSPEKTLYKGEAESIIVPGEKGRFEVLTNHAPIVSILTKGTIECQGAEKTTLDIEGGFIEVKDNAVSVCVEV